MPGGTRCRNAYTAHDVREGAIRSGSGAGYGHARDPPKYRCEGDRSRLAADYPQYALHQRATNRVIPGVQRADRSVRGVLLTREPPLTAHAPTVLLRTAAATLAVCAAHG